jgi:hypothetical protein
MVSGTESIATSPFRPGARFKIGDYSLTPPNAKHGPFLYNLHGAKFIEQWPLIIGQVKTGHESASQMQGSNAYLAGQNTAIGKDKSYQISSRLSFEYLRRIMAVLASGAEGNPKANRKAIIDHAQSILTSNLVGTDDTKPFLSIRILEDRTSREAEEISKEGGISLIVEATGKDVISTVNVAILPDKT